MPGPNPSLKMLTFDPDHRTSSHDLCPFSPHFLSHLHRDETSTQDQDTFPKGGKNSDLNCSDSGETFQAMHS